MTTTFKEDRFDLPEGLRGKNAKPYVDKLANLCPNCLIAETIISKKKKLSKLFNERYVQFVWNYIKHNNKKLFTKKDLMQGLDIEHISNGVLQDEALAILVVLGYIRKEFQEWITKDKERKQRAIYILKENVIPSRCYDPIKDKHVVQDWFNEGIKKRFYLKDKE